LIEIWYCNIDNYSEEDLQKFLTACAPAEKAEVLRYRFLKDRLCRFVGHQLVKMKYSVAFGDFRKTDTGKPYLASGQQFNIAHAGTMVTVAFAASDVGIDIEENKQIDIEGVSDLFHPEEIHFLKQQAAENYEAKFFDLWTRKEAFLKAVGNGIVNGLHHENCTLPVVNHEGQPYAIKTLPFLGNYHLSVCYRLVDDLSSTEIELKEIIL
jgi:4'-phosphopantetheinyl transferase